MWFWASLEWMRTKVPASVWLGLAALLLLTLAHLSGRWIEAQDCHERSLAETAKQVAAAVLETEKRYEAARDDEKVRAERESKDNAEEERIIGELHALDLPSCTIPADAMRLLDEAGR